MSYPLKNKSKIVSKAIIYIIVIFLIFMVSSFIFPNFLREKLTTISQPIWYVRDGVSSTFSNTIGYFTFKSNLISSNVKLQDELQSLRLKQIDYDLLLKENQDLKSAMGRVENSSRIISRIISKPPESPYDTLIIDAGVGAGIKKGSKVFLSNNVLIGIIVDVTAKTSLVELFSKGDAKHNLVLERTGATYEVTGSGGENMLVLVPKEADVLWGDSFVYPGLNSAIVGNVNYIDTNSQSSFKGIYLKIPGNVFSNKWVFVEN